jgi:hypothetical protein
VGYKLSDLFSVEVHSWGKVITHVKFSILVASKPDVRPRGTTAFLK